MVQSYFLSFCFNILDDFCYSYIFIMLVIIFGNRSSVGGVGGGGGCRQIQVCSNVSRKGIDIGKSQRY